MIARGATACAVILAAVLASSPTAVADEGECSGGNASFGCIAITDPPVKPRDVVTAQPGGSDESLDFVTPPLSWGRWYVPSLPIDPVPCNRETELADRFLVEYGAQWLVIVQRVDTGELVRIYTYCEWPGDDPPQPPAPPTPPSEFDSESTGDLALTTSLNPPPGGIGGVSQLPTWFWCSDPGPVDIEAAVSTSRSEATVEVAGASWRVSGPDGTFDLPPSNGCGSEPDIDSDGESAAATWTPNLPGDYEITLTTSWGGVWYAELFLDGAGWERFGPFGLEPIPVASEPVPYRVVEIQTVGGERSGD